MSGSDFYGDLGGYASPWGPSQFDTPTVWTGAYRGVLSIPGVWRAASLLSDLIGGLPWHAYRARVGGSPQLLDPTPPLLDRPNPPDVRVTTFSSWALDLILQGNAIGIYTARNAEGWPTACVPIPCDWVHARRVEAGDGVPLPVGSIAYRVSPPGVTPSWYSSDDVFHAKGMCVPGALRGLGILEHHLGSTFSLADRQNQWARNADNASVPSGVLNFPENLDGDQAARLKAQWKQAQQTRDVAVVSGGLTFTPMGWSPSDTQLLEARKFTTNEIALIFGLDPTWLGAAQSSRVYSNVEQEGINLVRYSLGGWLARIEQALTAALPRGTYAKAALDGILRADTLARYQAHESGIRAGWLSRDEARELEDRPPLTPKQRAELLPAPQEKTPPAPAPEKQPMPMSMPEKSKRRAA